jgi:hypothetical protein
MLAARRVTVPARNRVRCSPVGSPAWSNGHSTGAESQEAARLRAAVTARGTLTSQLPYPTPGRFCGNPKQTERELVPLLGQAKLQKCRRSHDEEGIQLGSETLRVQLAGKECRRSHNDEGIQLSSETLRVQFAGKPPLAQRLSSPAARRVDGYG